MFRFRCSSAPSLETYSNRRYVRRMPKKKLRARRRLLAKRLKRYRSAAAVAERLAAAARVRAAYVEMRRSARKEVASVT